MKKVKWNLELDQQALASRREMAEALKKDADIQNFLQKYHLDEQFLYRHTAALDQWKKQKARCAGCQSLDRCRQPLQGKVIELAYRDGMLEETFVSCYREESVDRARSHADNYRIYHGRPEDLEIDLDTLDVSRESREYLQAYLEVVRNLSSPKGIYLFGQPGAGKSYLMTGLTNRAARQQRSVSFVKVPLFMQDFKQSLQDWDYRQTMLARLKYSDVLVLDDIGSESITSWTRDEILLPVLDYRMQEGKKTCFTSNYTMEELEVRYALKDDRVAALRLMERIKALARPVRMAGVSRRQ